ncbi:MAG: amino acid adenylation domain-containing protein, partial [Actinobacteria bacterium]|nr:amino acid adenylation domain-containing protein [Actinomycetota bacterium]
VLRVDCGGDPGFGELVERTRNTVIDALDNQEIPYDRLVEMLAPDRSRGGMPLHQVVFNLLPLQQNAQLRNGTAKVDLLLDLAEGDHSYDGRLEYRGSLLTETDAEAFGSRLGRLLAAALAAPELPISRLPVLDETGRQQALAAGVPAGRQGEPPLFLDLFASRVLADPDRVAVRDATGHRLSYADLDRRSDELAARLASAAPVGPDTVVGILVETGVELPVAVLAVLKCGAAYLPLDQQHPAERMRFLLADAGAVAVLTQASLAGRLPATGLAEVRLDEPAGTSGPPAPKVTPPRQALAYVVYTSGSTGEPKGVGVEHRQLAGYLDEVFELLDLKPGRSFVQLQSLTFDFGLTMFYGALGSGGTLHVISRDFAADAYWVSEYLRREQVDYLKITPSHLRALLQGDGAALPVRHGLLLGGEASRWDWVRGLREIGRPVLNHYGPTETTVGALAYPSDRWPDGEPPTTPLGWPLARARCYLLDQWLQPVPDGVVGELFLGGETVSRGYLGRPAQTAARFLPDPFAAEAGARMYRTGDRALRRGDGSVEFLGRVDDQVKVRGYRVELGEVQHVLSGAPGVGQCAVVLRGGPTDAEAPDSEPQIVAYVVPAPGAGSPRPAIDPEALREFVAERLPEFMVPAFFVSLPELPLAAHGKVDRSRLPRPEIADGSSAEPAADAFDAPRGPVEDQVASVFERLLERQHVGRTDGFFKLGGHSLLAIQMVTRLRAAFGVAIPLGAVFKDPTVAGIAGQVQARLSRRSAQLPPVQVLPRGVPLPTSYGQRRLWFLDELESAGPLYNTNVCFRVTGELDEDLLRRAFVTVVERHEVLRSRFSEQDGELVQLVGEQAEVPFEIASADDPASATALLARHAEQGFALDREPPLRVLLVRLEAQQHLLLIVLHHIVNDAWSANLLATELAACYSGLRAEQPPQLPELPVQYADYAAWQRELVTGPLQESQLAYWRDRLAGMPQRLALPTDHPRPARRSYQGEHVGFRVPAAAVDRLRALGADENASLFMVLLTAFLVLLERYTGQDDLAVGTPASSRTRPEFEPLLGFFLNTLVLRSDCSGDPSFRELLQRVRTTALEAFANSDVPFEALVEELAPRRDLGSTPLVQAMFTLEDAERRPIDTGGIDGIELRWEPFGTATAKFDVTLYLWRRSDGLSGAVEYRTDLFDRPTMQRFADHYTALLAGAAAEPDQPCSRLPMLSDAEVAAVEKFNATDTEWTGAQTIPAVLAGQVATSPDATA